jgi:hypothetical protein
MLEKMIITIVAYAIFFPFLYLIIKTIFSSPTSKLDWSPAKKWGVWTSRGPHTVARTRVMTERAVINGSLGKVLRSSPPPIPKQITKIKDISAGKKTLEYEQLNDDELRSLCDALVKNDMANSEVIKPKKVNEILTNKFNPRDTIVDAVPYGSWDWQRIERHRAAKGKKGNR